MMVLMTYYETDLLDFRNGIDNMLQDRLICGVNNGRIQRCLLGEPSFGIKKAFETSLAMEQLIGPGLSLGQILHVLM